MFLKQIVLQNFRNYRQLSLGLNRGLNIFIGQNGQGKTNLLEAIQLLTSGKTFRPGKVQDWLRQGFSESVVRGSVEKPVGQSELSLGLHTGKKKWLLDGKSLSGAGMSKNFPSILFSPESLSVIKDGPEARRDFLDETLCSFSENNLRVVEAYQKVLKARNHLLKDHQRELIPQHQMHDLLISIDEPFLRAATHLAIARLESIKALSEDFNSMVHRIDSTLAVDVSVDYLISDARANDWDENQIHNAMRKRLAELRSQEMAVGHSLVGPHKHDVRILYGGQDSRFWCSQGQQRALILSFKLARIVYHNRVHKQDPFLLLDDVLSELDAEKRANLVAVLSHMNGQIFVTSTELSLPADFLARERSVFQVRNGSIEQVE